MFSANCFVWLGDWFPLHFLHSLTVNYPDFTEIWLSLYCNCIYNLWTYVIVVQWLFSWGKDWKMWNSERIREVNKDYKVQTGWVLLIHSCLFPLKYARIDLKEIWNTVFFIFWQNSCLLSYVFALIGNLGLFLSPESLSVISGASGLPQWVVKICISKIILIYLKICDTKHFLNTFDTLSKVKM